MSYTAWHVRDMNFPSVIYHHFGAPKFWIIVPQAFATRLINLFKAEVPDYYEKCEAAETHKNILAFPQILKAANPPIPFICIKQCVGQYVVTFPGAYHMVLNSGYNVCEGLNFSVDRWTRKYAKKERKCTCDLKPKPEDDVSLSFKIE
ncbi:hypothetical protein DAPPUDRAFT_255987 [Daphnia pulex]|uniref:JmjC domain-containing protein n=1 Tax=Daphnia pulex TaxID=6669 RepID=E9HAG1_DAPPU|nr:hypothetical protein DAPPUDRAFT_255987 [Daphnia pulex]|eukprot:EFX71269.1 hypothetical protein DAPPUDRAFT_255987 [Daphnia pulex]